MTWTKASSSSLTAALTAASTIRSSAAYSSEDVDVDGDECIGLGCRTVNVEGGDGRGDRIGAGEGGTSQVERGGGGGGDFCTAASMISASRQRRRRPPPRQKPSWSATSSSSSSSSSSPPPPPSSSSPRYSAAAAAAVSRKRWLVARWCRAAALFWIAAAITVWTSAEAKTISGDFRLSGVNSHRVLTSYAVVPDGAKFQLNMTADTLYENERFLKLRFYRDVEWALVQKMPTCVEKIRSSQQTMDVTFDSYDRDGHWKTKPMNMFVANKPDGTSDRPHYWYFVVDDCSLEQYMQDNKIPNIHYDLKVLNMIPKNDSNKNKKDGGDKNNKKGEGGPNFRVSHLSADELHLATWHTITLALSGMVAFFLVMNVVMGAASAGPHSNGDGGGIHAALLWVALAAVLDACSSFCEILHLKIYDMDGVGSYVLDAAAAHFEASCDSLLIVFLLCVGSGWTMPPDVVPSNNPDPNFTQRLVMNMSHPIGALQQRNSAFYAMAIVVATHVGLAQWGRIYDDDFESYHDLEHPPGKVLMSLRVAFGLLFVTASLQTRMRCTVGKLRTFYAKFCLVGFAWCQSLPALTWACNHLVPYYLRHPAVFIGSALSQSSSLIMLAWLVTAHSTVYHRYSHMTPATSSSSSSPSAKLMTIPSSSMAGAGGGLGTTRSRAMGGGGGEGGHEPSLTDSLSNYQQRKAAPSAPNEGPRTWKIGKAKVRLD